MPHFTERAVTAKISAFFRSGRTFGAGQPTLISALSG